MKRSRALLAALPLLALTLAGCSVGGSGGAVDSAIKTDAADQECAAAGAVSNAITVSGDFGTQLTLDTEAPVGEVGSLERSVLIEGETTPFAEGEVAVVSMSVINGATGELINFFPDTTLVNDEAQLVGADWAYQGMRCGATGQRAAVVVEAEEAIGVDPAEAGFTDLAAGDSVVIVFDFAGPAEPYDQFADCEVMTPRDAKYPEVTFGSGSPQVTIPECMEPPAELELKVLEAGSGAEIALGDSVMTSYVGVTWNGGEVFNDYWDETGVEFSTEQVIAGFRDALVGQKVGSTILVTIPPAEAYGVESPELSGNQLSGQTLTFVLKPISLVE